MRAVALEPQTDVTSAGKAYPLEKETLFHRATTKRARRRLEWAETCTTREAGTPRVAVNAREWLGPSGGLENGVTGHVRVLRLAEDYIGAMHEAPFVS